MMALPSTIVLSSTTTFDDSIKLHTEATEMMLPTTIIGS